jgi:methyltransferase (TIGR00027 family)
VTAASGPGAGAALGTEPDSTAVRTALWRALHVQLDPPPHVIEDEVGLALAQPADGWRDRPDMDPEGTKGLRAGMAARARFVEDLVTEQVAHGADQYVILGAGLDTYAQRRPDMAGRLRVYEVDQAGTQAWKRRRLTELGYGVPDWLRLVPVDFEKPGDWWARLAEAGFDPGRRAVVACTGVTMYLTREAITATLRQLATLAPGSTLAVTFLLPPELLSEDQRPVMRASQDGARSAGTPFVSFFAPEELAALAVECGFREARPVSAPGIAERYFGGRPDGLRPARGEEFLLAVT